MKIKSIHIIGMHKVTDKTYNLNDLTYLFGKNGAGKSTVLQAIQLALLGYIPGTDKNKTAIFRHANGLNMSVELTFDDETTIQRSWVNTGKTIEATVTMKPDGLDIESIVKDLELPIFNFNEFVGMSANKLKDWFIDFLPEVSSKVDWRRELTSAAKESLALEETVLTPAMDFLNASESLGELERTRTFNGYCKEQISLSKKESERLQSTIQNLIYYSDCDTSADENELREDIRLTEVRLENTQGKLYKLHNVASIDEKLKSIASKINADSLESDPDYIEKTKKIEEIEEKLEQATSKVNSVYAEITDVKSMLHNVQSVLSKGGVCPYTNELCPTIGANLTAMNTESIQYEQKLMALTAEHKELTANASAYTQYISDLRRQIDEISFAYNRYSMWKEELAQISDDFGSREELEAEEAQIKAELAEKRTNLEHFIKNKEHDRLIEKLSEDKYKADLSLNIYKAWEKLSGVNGLQTKLMWEPFDAFASVITSYLSKFFGAGVAAGFHISDKANSFSFGIIVEDKYIPYDLLSSGEKCLYTLALIIAVVENGASPLKVILVDDILDHLDSEKIDSCFSTLYSINSVQIVLAGVRIPNHPKFDEFTERI